MRNTFLLLIAHLMDLNQAHILTFVVGTLKSWLGCFDLFDAALSRLNYFTK